ncbi:MAG: DUF1853 family protein [Vibrio sp.]
MNLSSLIHWVIDSPSIIAGAPPVESHSPFLSSHSSLPSAPYTGNHRLGFVYQYVCGHLFQQHPEYNAVHEELQINSQGRTLGAIDFINQHRSGSWQHWEVAIKFYLLKDGFWYGPHAHDRLDLKVQHMLEKQLPFSQSDAFQHAYPDWPTLTQHLLMQGRLYINPFSEEVAPDSLMFANYQPEKTITINQQRTTGYWCYQHEAWRIKDPLFLLNKPEWITGRRDSTPRYHHDASGFVHCQSQSGQFWFIVPDTWPNNQ